MKTIIKTPKVFFKNTLKMLVLSSMLLATSCVEEEVDSNSLLISSNSNNLSTKSVLLTNYDLIATAEQEGNTISNIDDNDLSTRWAGYGTSANLVYDFGVETFVDYVKIYFLSGNERVYKLTYWGSDDNVSWHWLGGTSSSGLIDGFETFDLTNTTTRYFRLKFEGNSVNDWNSVYELEVYGTPSNIDENIECIVTAPIGLVASEEGSFATLSWGALSNIDHYNLRYRVNGTLTWTYVNSIDVNSVKIEDLTPNTMYEYQVRAKCVDGTGSDYKAAAGTFTTTNNDSESTEEELTRTNASPYSILGNVIKDWKITYPVDEDGNDSADADDCDDRNKDAYEMRDLTKEIPSEFADYFFVSGDEVVFKAHVGGATTSGSSYPRSEFRQLVGGDDNYWSMDDYQYLEVRVRATHLPEIKPEVSMVQIHGPDDEPLRVEYREDSQGLHVVQNEDTTVTYIMDYELGQQLYVTVTVDEGDITLYIKNEDTGETYKDTWEADDKTGYFKVGCYTQSNNNLKTCKRGEGYDNQDADEYGEVRIKDLILVETY